MALWRAHDLCDRVLGPCRIQRARGAAIRRAPLKREPQPLADTASR